MSAPVVLGIAFAEVVHVLVIDELAPCFSALIIGRQIGWHIIVQVKPQDLVVLVVSLVLVADLLDYLLNVAVQHLGSLRVLQRIRLKVMLDLLAWLNDWSRRGRDLSALYLVSLLDDRIWRQRAVTLSAIYG